MFVVFSTFVVYFGFQCLMTCMTLHLPMPMLQITHIATMLATTPNM
jgi:hypothetical protein